MTIERENSAPRRLNPFAFPPETRVRFALLILAVVMLAVSTGGLLGIALNLAKVLLFHPELFSLSETVPEMPPQTAPSDEMTDLSVASALSGVGEVLGRLLIPAAAVLLVLLLAVAIYRTHPGRVRRRRKLAPLDPDQDPAMYEAVRGLATRVAISPSPTVEIGKGLRGQDAQAFGLPGAYSLGLDGGVRLLLRKLPEVFEALILHELAHIVNRDVWRAYFAEALWRAAIFVCAVPFFLVIVGLAVFSGVLMVMEGSVLSGLTLFIFGNLLGILVLLLILGIPLGLVMLIRDSLLRVREFYADWRSVLWGAEAPLRRILSAAAGREEGRRKLRLRRYHPTARKRLAMLEDPIGLFRPTRDLPLIAGLLLGFVGAGIISQIFKLLGILQAGINASLVGLVDSAQPGSYVAVIFAGLIPPGLYLILCLGLGYLVAGTVGLQIQREAVAALSSGRDGCASYLRLGGLAGLLAVGLEGGFLIVPPYQFSPVGALIGGLDPGLLLLVVPWLIGFISLTWLALVYLRFFATRLLGSHAGTSPPTRQSRILTLALSMLLGVFYLSLFAGRTAIIYPDPSDSILVGVLLVGLVVGLVLYVVVLGATSLLIAIRRRSHPLRCPSCGDLTQQKQMVGRSCEHCHRDLAPWLYADGPSAAQTAELEPETLAEAGTWEDDAK